MTNEEGNVTETKTDWYAERVAPMPTTADPEGLIKHLLCYGIQHSARDRYLYRRAFPNAGSVPTSKAAGDAYVSNIEVMTLAWTTAFALRGTGRDSTTVQATTDVVWEALEDGEQLAEWAWSVASEYGIDADRVFEETEKAVEDAKVGEVSAR
jgi:hypothetical protein